MADHVEMKDFVILGSANMAEDDDDTPVGGARCTLASATKMTFKDRDTGTDTMKVLSEDAADTQNITIYTLDGSGAQQNEVVALNGETWAAGSLTCERILKVTRASAGTGNACAVYNTTTNSGTCQGGADGENPYVTLDAAETGVEIGEVLIVDIDGDKFIREVIKWDNTNKRAYVSMPFDGTAPDSDDTYELYRGVVFENFGTTPAVNILKVCRPFYMAAAEEPGGSSKDIYEKVHIYNLNEDKTLTQAKIREVSDPLDKITFDVEDALDDNDQTTNRVTAPGTYTFTGDDGTDLDVSNSGNFTYEKSQGVWLKLTLAAGSTPSKDVYRLGVIGQTI